MLEMEGQLYQAYCGLIDNGIDIFLPSGHFSFVIQNAHTDELEQETSVDTVLSPLPGVVQSLLVAPGDEVSPNQPIIVLEAMKMNHTLTASGPATVESIHCSEGEQVSEGAILLRFAHYDPLPGLQK